MTTSIAPDTQAAVSEPVLTVSNLGKTYRIYNHPRDKVKQALRGKKRQYFRDFKALEAVSFSLAKGEVLGIVGRNGSGKSTLLKLISGVLRASQGEVVRRGRIGALLELGSGFDPEFSGRDNLYLNATLLGLTEEQINAKVDNILAFADLGRFIEQPVKTYSTGMRLRLAFAIQAQTDPDILLIDEALAVGDAFFQRRCMQRLEELKQAGTSILIVTHSNQAIVQHCDRALLLHHGRMRLMAPPKLVIRVYERLESAPAEQWEALLNQIGSIDPATQSDDLDSALGRGSGPPAAPLSQAKVDQSLASAVLSRINYESNGGQIVAVEVLDDQDNLVNVLPMGSAFSLRFYYKIDAIIEQPKIGCNLSNSEGLLITGKSLSGGHPEGSGIPDRLTPGTWTARFTFYGGLMPGIYFIGCAISSAKSGLVHKLRDFTAFRVSAHANLASFGVCDLAIGPIAMESVSAKDR